jgi:hypothetical protein
MDGEVWKDIPEFDGHYSISNFGRIWAAPRLVISSTNQLYFTKERIRKQSLTRYFNSYSKDHSLQLSVNLRYERKAYAFRVSRLVYHFFVGPINMKEDHLMVVHKDGDNCNNRYDNLVLMTGTELYKRKLDTKRVPRSGRKIKKATSGSPQNSARPVIKYSLNGKKIKEYASVAEAALDNKTHRSSIRAIVKKELMQLYGYVYRYKGEPYKGEFADLTFEKQVTQYAIHGKKIATYPSIKEASQRTGVDPNSISKCAKGKKRIAGGFVWRYAGGDYHGEYEGKIKNSRKSIVQYSLEGKKIISYSSVNQAAMKTGFSAATLLACAYKRTHVSHGFVWRFEHDQYHGEHRHHQAGKPVTQYDLSGKKMKTYNSIESAARATGLTPDNIQKNVKGNNHTAGGFIWKYASLNEIRKLPAPKPRTYSQKPSGTKEIIQYSLEGKKLGVYKSISEASRAIGLAGSGVGSALDNPSRSSGGFVWRSKGNVYRGNLAKNPVANKARVVTQYDLQGRKLKIYPSTKKAEAATGIHATTISQVALGKLKTTGGYIWQYGNGAKRLDVEKYFAASRQRMKRISKAVTKHHITGEFICEYPSIGAAARQEGIAVGRISSAVNGKSQSAGGNLWRLRD